MGIASTQSNQPAPVHSTIYENGEYLRKNPGWHVHESAWKAKQVARMRARHRLAPCSVCDIGCGAGEVLKQLQPRLPLDCELVGYDVSPQALRICQQKTNARLRFELRDITREDVSFDLALVLDVIEHLKDYFTFLRAIRTKARHLVFHIPLDVSVQVLLRPGGMSIPRNQYEHLHCFTRELALRALEDTGYEVLDCMYTPRANQLGTALRQKLLVVPRSVLFSLNRDFAARLLGGYSILVLALASQAGAA